MSSYGHPLANPDDFNFNEESYPIAGGVIGGGGEDYRPHTAFSSHYDDDQTAVVVLVTMENSTFRL